MPQPPNPTLSAAVEKHLRQATGGAVTVHALTPLHGGACQDNYRVELTVEGQRRVMALRSDAPTSLPGSINRAVEFDITRAAVAAQVPTPAAHWPGVGLVREGAHAYFLDWVEGEALGRVVVKSPQLAGARVHLPGQLAAALARIHSVTPSSAPRLQLSVGPPQHPAREHLAALRTMMAGLPAPQPGLELCCHWLEESLPKAAPVTLVHGDFRTGNFMVTPAGLQGVLDWEFAHWGDPMEDVAWLCLRDWRFGALDLPVGGLCARQPFLDAYVLAGGAPVDKNVIHFWEVMGNVRWALGCAYQGARFQPGQDSSLELLAVARRAVEMEFEALRLIEKGPAAT